MNVSMAKMIVITMLHVKMLLAVSAANVTMDMKAMVKPVMISTNVHQIYIIVMLWPNASIPTVDLTVNVRLDMKVLV